MVSSGSSEDPLPSIQAWSRIYILGFLGPIILASQEAQEFEASLSNIARSCVKTNKCTNTYFF
jgi:hypothetical protein